jgi:hypothetical protein
VILQKTHNLVVLLESCIEFDASFEVLRDSAESLTPYATEFRYLLLSLNKMMWRKL